MTSAEKIIGQLIADRKAAGISLYKVAQASGMSQQALQYLEDNPNSAKLNTAAKYRAALDALTAAKEPGQTNEQA